MCVLRMKEIWLNVWTKFYRLVFFHFHLEHLLSSVNDHRQKVPFLNYVPQKQASFKAYFFLRSRTIYLLECLLTDLVILPFVGLPQGDTGDGRPIGVRPSPPPCG